MLIPIDKILPNPEQPRSNFDTLELENLAESIKLHGLINAISVEEAGGQYILIDGERRWRAARIAGLTEIEASVRPGMNGAGGLERLILATTANLQRADMTPLEKANAFRKLEEAGMSHYAIGNAVGVTVATVDNMLLILRLPNEIQQLIHKDKLSPSAPTIRALLSIPEPDVRLTVAQAAASKGLTATAVELLARRVQQGKKVGKHKKVGVKSAAELSVRWAGRWNMIAQAGNPQISDALKEACLETCKVCDLFDKAAPKYCKYCPAVDLLKKIIKAECAP